MKHHPSNVTLGDLPENAEDRLKNFNRTFDATNLNEPDLRLKPLNLKKHKNSDFDQYLVKHSQGSPKCVPTPFPINEDGRFKKTQVLDHIIKIKRDTIKRNSVIMEEHKKKNEDVFVNYLLTKKEEERQEKRALQMRRESEAFGKKHSNSDLEKNIRGNSSAVVSEEDVQSSSSEENKDAEGFRSIKDIEKLTKTNLDIKSIDLDVGAMRKLQHTPKNGVSVPIDTAVIMQQLDEKGFLLFNPNMRPSQVARKKIEECEQAANEILNK